MSPETSKEEKGTNPRSPAGQGEAPSLKSLAHIVSSSDSTTSNSPRSASANPHPEPTSPHDSRTEIQTVKDENLLLKSQLEDLKSASNTQLPARSGDVGDPRRFFDSESSARNLPGQVRHLTVEFALLRARAAAILKDWKSMEELGNYAMQQAAVLGDPPFSALCFFTIGIALYSQGKFILASDAFRFAIPCQGVCKTNQELTEWMQKTDEAMRLSAVLSTAPPRSSMPMPKVPNPGATAADTPFKAENLTGFPSAGPVSAMPISSVPKSGVLAATRHFNWHHPAAGKILAQACQMSATAQVWQQHAKRYSESPTAATPKSREVKTKEESAIGDEAAPSETTSSSSNASVSARTISPASDANQRLSLQAEYDVLLQKPKPSWSKRKLVYTNFPDLEEELRWADEGLVGIPPEEQERA